jgi:hypothetical protein
VEAEKEVVVVALMTKQGMIEKEIFLCINHLSAIEMISNDKQCRK